MKAKGNRKAFEIGALVGALAYAIQAVSWMPHGASKLRVSIQCKHLHQASFCARRRCAKV